MPSSNPPISAKRSARTSVQAPGMVNTSRTASCCSWSSSPRSTSGDGVAGVVDALAHLQEPPWVVPGDQLRAHDGGVRAERLLDQQSDDVGLGGDVVVADQVEGGSLDDFEDLVGGGPEAGVVLEPAHEGAGRGPRHAGLDLLGAGRVDHQDRQVRVVLGGEGRHRLLEPRPGVVGNHHDHDRRRDGQGRGQIVGRVNARGRGGPRSSEGSRTPTRPRSTADRSRRANGCLMTAAQALAIVCRGPIR